MNAAFGFRADFFFLATAVSFVEGRPIGVGGAYHIREAVGLRFQRGFGEDMWVFERTR